MIPLRQRQFVTAEAAVAAFEGAPSINPERFFEDIDAVLDQSPAPRR